MIIENNNNLNKIEKRKLSFSQSNLSELENLSFINRNEHSFQSDNNEIKDILILNKDYNINLRNSYIMDNIYNSKDSFEFEILENNINNF